MPFKEVPRAPLLLCVFDSPRLAHTRSRSFSECFVFLLPATPSDNLAFLTALSLLLSLSAGPGEDAPLNSGKDWAPTARERPSERPRELSVDRTPPSPNSSGERQAPRQASQPASLLALREGSGDKEPATAGGGAGAGASSCSSGGERGAAGTRGGAGESTRLAEQLAALEHAKLEAVAGEDYYLAAELKAEADALRAAAAAAEALLAGVQPGDGGGGGGVSPGVGLLSSSSALSPGRGRAPPKRQGSGLRGDKGGSGGAGGGGGGASGGGSTRAPSTGRRRGTGRDASLDALPEEARRQPSSATGRATPAGGTGRKKP